MLGRLLGERSCASRGEPPAPWWIPRPGTKARAPRPFPGGLRRGAYPGADRRPDLDRVRLLVAPSPPISISSTWRRASPPPRCGGARPLRGGPARIHRGGAGPGRAAGWARDRALAPARCVVGPVFGHPPRPPEDGARASPPDGLAGRGALDDRGGPGRDGGVAGPDARGHRRAVARKKSAARPPTVLDEVHTGLFYFEESSCGTGSSAARWKVWCRPSGPPGPPTLPALRLWMGGDRDGNLQVTAAESRATLRAKDTALACMLGSWRAGAPPQHDDRVIGPRPRALAAASLTADAAALPQEGWRALSGASRRALRRAVF
jgi:hypothetical protein